MNLEQESSHSKTGIIHSFQREISHVLKRGVSIATRLSLILAVLTASEYAFIPTTSAQKESTPPDTSDIPLYPTERSILNSLTINSSDDERNQWIIAVRRYARLTDSLDISGCEANPPSFIIPLGQPEIRITNTDAEDHNLYLGGVFRFPVPANSTTTFDTSAFQEEFDRGSEAFYIYNCDDEYLATAGIFYLARFIDNP